MTRKTKASLDLQIPEHTYTHRESLVSRETEEDIRKYVSLLTKWQKTINLVGKNMTSDRLQTHINEAVEIALSFPKAKKWVDLGSGSGLPGIIIGLVFKNSQEPNFHLELVESDQRKAAFLREALREIGIPGIVHTSRIENIIETLNAAVISAKALADLKTLIDWVLPLLRKGATAVFPKGPRVFEELNDLPALPGLLIELRPMRSQKTHFFVILKYVTNCIHSPGAVIASA